MSPARTSIQPISQTGVPESPGLGLRRLRGTRALIVPVFFLEVLCSMTPQLRAYGIWGSIVAGLGMSLWMKAVLPCVKEKGFIRVI